MSALVAYYGGRVVSNVAVVAVFWTADVDVDLQQKVGPFYAAVTASSYVDWLSEYDTLGQGGADGRPGSAQHIGRGRFAGAFTIEPSDLSNQIDDAQISGELAAQIAAGRLPSPALDAAGNVNTLYVVEMPPGTTVTFLGGTSCVDFCAYHWTVALDGHSVPYAVFADMHGCAGACGQGFDDQTILRSHEIAEAVTDTESGLVDPADVAAGSDVYPMAWAGDGGAKGEIGDLCFHGFVGDHDVVAGYAVQRLWSNYAGACVSGIPICDGSTQPPACRACTSRDDGAACSGSTPVCDPASGRCRACTGGECADAGPPADAGASSRTYVEAGAPTRAGAGGDASVHGGSCALGDGATGGAMALDALVLAAAGLLRRKPR